MASTIDQKAYLQKYLSGPSKDKRKKKKKKSVKGTGLKIIDDDVDLSKLRPLDDDELDLLAGDEDAPQVAGIIDERPDEVKKMEQFNTSSKWKVISQDDGFNSKLRIEEIKKSITKIEDEKNPIFGKMYSDSEDDKNNDSDLSPPRKPTKNGPCPKQTKNMNKSTHNLKDSIENCDIKASKSIEKKNNYSTDSDQSPPRTKHNRSKVENDSDGDQSPVRKRNRQEGSHKERNESDSDLSPPRRHEQQKSKERKRPSRWGHFEAETKSTHRQPNASSDSDLSPPRKSKKSSPPPRRRDRSNDSDLSPPRHSHRRSPMRKRSPDRNKYSGSTSGVDRTDKARTHRNEESNRRSDYRNNSERSKHEADSRPRPDRRNSDSPPPSNKKMARTLEGKHAGLQDAKKLQKENAEFRRREEEMFQNLSEDVSGKYAKAVSRKTGKRETSVEKEQRKADVVKQKELEEKYHKWGKGLKQIREQEERVQDFVHEASKPLARYRGDRDLEASQRRQERDGDPMLQYMRDKDKEKGELVPEIPTYKGSFPPNRFNIRPGYRWDGVDRSNGYEKKYFESKSSKKALEEEAYKWSTEDL